jgi:HAD superfamily hydrolase (TIGR01509 family)
VAFEALWAQYPRKRELFMQRVIACPPIEPEVVSFIKSLSPYHLAVVSSSKRSEVYPVLERAGIAQCFGAVVCAEDVERHKPSPEPYLLAARRLAVERALVVEDSRAGLEAGRAAGFEVVAVQEARRMPEVVRSRLISENP